MKAMFLPPGLQVDQHRIQQFVSRVAFYFGIKGEDLRISQKLIVMAMVRPSGEYAAPVLAPRRLTAHAWCWY